MATRTSLYLRDDLETEIKLRANRRLGSDDMVSMGHVITRHLNVIFEGYKICRSRVAENLKYEEMRFLLSVVGADRWDEDDFEAPLQLQDNVGFHWTDVQARFNQEPIDKIDEARAKDANWLYWDKIEPSVLTEKIEAMHLFDVMALIDGLQTVLVSEKPDRELVRLFKGVKRPVWLIPY